MTICAGDFQLSNTWEVDRASGARGANGRPQFIRDLTTGKRYFNDSEELLRAECGGLVVVTPIAHLLAPIGIIFYKFCKILQGTQFWDNSGERPRLTFKAGMVHTIKELGEIAKFVIAPLAIIPLEAAALYGLLINPHDGRKFYATIERVFYGDEGLIAPYFQPVPDPELAASEPEGK